MSTRDRAISIINGMSEEQLKSVIDILIAIDEQEDDNYCKKLLEDYLNDNDTFKHENVTLEDLAKELEIEKGA